MRILLYKWNKLNRNKVYKYLGKSLFLNNISNFDLNLEYKILSKLKLKRINLFLEEIKLLGVEFKENFTPFGLIYLPNIEGYKLGYFGTKGEVIDKFPRIYSNWQIYEKDSENFLHSKISSGWYLYSRFAIKNFFNLSFIEQNKETLYLNIEKIIKKYFGERSRILPDINSYYACILFDTILINKISDMPLLNSFVRTNTKYSDGTYLGILGSSKGIDIDGFWHGNEGSSFISIGICIKV